MEARSSGSPSLGSAVFSDRASRTSGGVPARTFSVRTTPGATALARMFFRPHAWAVWRVSACRAILDEAYAVSHASRCHAAREETLTIEPPPAATRAGRLSRITSPVPVTLMRIMSAHTSGSMVSTPWSRAMRSALTAAATLATPSSRPNRSVVRATREAMEPSSRRSNRTVSSRSAASDDCSRIRASFSALVPAAVTRAPSASSRRTVTAPMPDPPPVTMKTLSLSPSTAGHILSACEEAALERQVGTVPEAMRREYA